VTNKPLPLAPIRAPSFSSFNNKNASLANAALTVPPSAALSDTPSDISTPRSTAVFFAITKDASESSCGSGNNFRYIARRGVSLEEMGDHVDDEVDRRTLDVFSFDPPGQERSRRSPSSRRTESTGSAISTSISISSANHPAEKGSTSTSSSGTDAHSTPRASLSVESSTAFHPILCSSPELVSEDGLGSFEGQGDPAEMKFSPSYASSFRTATPTPSSASNGTSVRSLVDFPMNVEDDPGAFNAFTRSRTSYLPSSNTPDVAPLSESGESPPVGHRQHRSMYDKPRSSTNPKEKGPFTALSRNSSRVADGIERLWKSKSFSFAYERSTSSRSSVYDPGLGEDHDYFQAETKDSRGVYGPFRLSTLDK